MEIFEYSTFGVKWKVQVDRTMITFQSPLVSKTVSRGTMKAIGIATAAASSFGRKETDEIGEINKNADFHELPGIAQLVISYNEGPEKTKTATISLNSADENCIRMLEKVKEDFSELYLGVAEITVMRKAMGLSNTKNTIILVAIVLLFVGINVLYQIRHVFNS